MAKLMLYIGIYCTCEWTFFKCRETDAQPLRNKYIQERDASEPANALYACRHRDRLKTLVPKWTILAQMNYPCPNAYFSMGIAIEDFHDFIEVNWVGLPMC